MTSSGPGDGGFSLLTPWDTCLAGLARPGRDIFQGASFVVQYQVPEGIWRFARYFVPPETAEHFSIWSIRARGRELLRDRVAAICFADYVRQRLLLGGPVLERGQLLSVSAILEDDWPGDFASVAALERV